MRISRLRGGAGDKLGRAACLIGRCCCPPVPLSSASPRQAAEKFPPPHTTALAAGSFRASDSRLSEYIGGSRVTRSLDMKLTRRMIVGSASDGLKPDVVSSPTITTSLDGIAAASRAGWSHVGIFEVVFLGGGAGGRGKRASSLAVPMGGRRKSRGGGSVRRRRRRW